VTHPHASWNVATRKEEIIFVGFAKHMQPVVMISLTY